MGRREYLRLASASPLLAGGLWSRTGRRGRSQDGEGGPFSVAQPDRGYVVYPLTGEESVEEFYALQNGSSQLEFTENRHSILTLYRGAGATSLVVVHNEPNKEERNIEGYAAGVAPTEFRGLPEEGSWVVKDDSQDFGRGDGNTVGWRWNRPFTDGGAFRGGLESATVTVDPEFERGVDEWYFLSAVPGDSDPVALSLDTSQPVTIAGPATQALWIVPDARSEVAPLSVLPTGENAVDLRVGNGSGTDYEGLALSASFTGADETGDPAQRPNLPVEVTGTTPSSGFDVPARHSRGVDVAVTTDDASGGYQLSTEVSGAGVTASETFDVTVVDPLDVSVSVGTELPVVAGRELLLEFEVAANDVAPVEEPEVTVDLAALGSGWEPDLTDVWTSVDGGSWSRSGGNARWTTDRIPPGGVHTPTLVVGTPEAAAPDPASDDAVTSPGEEFRRADGVYQLPTTATVPEGDGRRTVDETTTAVPLASQPLSLTVETPSEQFAGGGAIPVDVTVANDADGPVEVRSFDLALSGLPLGAPDAPDHDPEVTETSESAFQGSLSVAGRGIEGTVRFGADEPVTVTDDDPIELGLEFEPPVSTESKGTHRVAADLELQRADTPTADLYSTTAAISIGEAVFFAARARELSRQIDELGDFEDDRADPGAIDDADRSIIDESPRVADRVDELLEAADDDDHPLTVAAATDALERLYQGERVIRRSMQVLRPLEKSFTTGGYGSETEDTIEAFEHPTAGSQLQGKPNLCFRTASSVVKIIVIVGLAGAALSKVADELANTGSKTLKTIARGLDDDVLGGGVVNFRQNLGPTGREAASIVDRLDDPADRAAGDVDEAVGTAAGAVGKPLADVAGQAGKTASDAADAALDKLGTVFEHVRRWAAKLKPAGRVVDRIGRSLLGSAWTSVAGRVKLEAQQCVTTMVEKDLTSLDSVDDLINGRLRVVVEKANRNIVWPLAVELYKDVKNRGSLVVTAARTTPGGVVGGAVTRQLSTTLQPQLDKLVERYDPDSVASGLAGDQSAARTMGQRGVDWISRRASLSVETFENFSQGVPKALSFVDEFFEQVGNLYKLLDRGDLGEAVPTATKVIDGTIEFVKDVLGIVGGLSYGPVLNAAVGLWSLQELVTWSDFAVKGVVQGEKAKRSELLTQAGKP